MIFRKKLEIPEQPGLREILQRSICETDTAEILEDQVERKTGYTESSTKYKALGKATERQRMPKSTTAFIVFYFLN